MTRAVYIGGFGNGKRSAHGVANALVAGGYYEEVDPYTFAYAMRHPEEIERAVEGVDALTHSAGIIAVKYMKPKEIRAVGAPLPTTIPELVLNTGKKTARMIGHSFSDEEAFKAVNRYNASSIGELVAHPVSNIGHIKAIAGTNSIRLAAQAQEVGIPTWLYYNEQDDYYPLVNVNHTLAHTLGVSIELIPGRHDQLPLYPADTLQKIYNR